LFLENKLSEL